MRLGAIIRSIGERTENLCFASLNEYIAEEDIHIFRHVSPPYSLSIQEFEYIAQSNYDYVIKVDADIILHKDWYKLVYDYVNNKKSARDAYIAGVVFDSPMQSMLFAGIHIYPQRLGQLGVYFTKCSRYLSVTPDVAKLVGGTFTTRIESNIHEYFKIYNLKRGLVKDTYFGWHGYEQFNIEIFRRFAIRHLRDDIFHLNKHARVFLGAHVDESTLSLQHQIARLGWYHYDIIRPNMKIEEAYEVIGSFLESRGIAPFQEPLQMSLEEFREKYQKDLDFGMKQLRKDNSKFLKFAYNCKQKALGFIRHYR